MCFVLPSDLNQPDQQVSRHQHLAVDSRLASAGRLACSAPRCLRYFALGLLLLRTTFKWIYRSRQPLSSNARRLMQPVHGQPATGRPSTGDALRLPPSFLTSFLTSFCLNKIYLLPNLLPDFENLLIRLLLYSLVYHQVRPILTYAVFYSRLSALAFSDASSGALELAADLATDVSSGASLGSTLAGLSPDGTPPSSSPSDVQFLLPFFSLLLSSSTFLRSSSLLRDLFLSTTLLPLDRFLRIHFAASRELRSATSSSCQKRNLKLSALLSERLFSPRNGSSYKLPKFRLFLNEFASKSSSAFGVGSAITSTSTIHSASTIIRSAANEHGYFKENRLGTSKFAKPFRSYLAILLVLLNATVPSQGAVRKATLYTAGFFPLSGEKADLGLGILPAVQLALDDITENDVIPGYKLDLVGNDTMVSRPFGFASSLRFVHQWSSPMARIRFSSLFIVLLSSLPILLHNSEPFK